MTFEEFHLALKEVTHPSGVPINLDTPYRRLVIEGLLYLQKWVHCLQAKNSDVYEFCDSVLSCGASVVSAPAGRIRRVYTSSLDYCDVVDYRQMSYEALLCEARKVKYGANPPASFAYGLPRPFYATFYGGNVNTGTDTACGRSNFGFYAIHNQRLYLAPFLDSSEVLTVEWVGLKRSYGDDDTVSDDPEVFRAVQLYITKAMALAYEHDEVIYAGATREFQEALADLIHECNEETRVRESSICTDPAVCGTVGEGSVLVPTTVVEDDDGDDDDQGEEAQWYFSGSGDPNGVVTATVVPALYHDNVNLTFWFKDAGPGTNTGWVL